MLLFFVVLFRGLFSDVTVPENYYNVVEKLIYYKDDRFKVFYGGPIDGQGAATWLMPALFENEGHKTRAVYEISFINCLPEEAEGAEIYFIQVSDIDVKFRNLLSNEYLLFDGIVKNGHFKRKCILVREADVSNVCYPHIFVAAAYSEFKEGDREALVGFLKSKFKASGEGRYLTMKKRGRRLAGDGLVEKRQVLTQIAGASHCFEVEHYYIEEDPWKSYYVVRGKEAVADPVLLRIDSGCTSGQIYHDNACDCLEQLEQGLTQVACNQRALLIHIPGHDGRGFGMAPKAETEIYKRGGAGRVHTMDKVDTVQAATLLYGTSDFDIRTFDGCAKILKDLNISHVHLLTDNKMKAQALNDQGLQVTRMKTNSRKESCLEHLRAKMKSKYYYQE
jgi:GTP cyclohydrolase II